MIHNSKFVIKKHLILENLDNIFKNLDSKVKVIPMLKANAYGHGLVEMATLLSCEDRIQMLGVAQVSEGVTLREAGISSRIILFCGFLKDQIEYIIKHQLEPCVYDMPSLTSLIEVLKSKNIKTYPVHLSINTGLNRLGFTPGPLLEEALQVIKHSDEIQIVSTYSHAIEGATRQSKHVIHQHDVYLQALKQIQAHGIDTGYQHFCDSGTSEWFHEAHHDAIRIGRKLYMDDPNLPHETRHPDVGSWYASLSLTRSLAAGESVGYSRSFIAPKNMELGIVNVGYGDGMLHYTYDMNLYVMLGDYRARIISVMMDQTLIDITDIPCKVGDTVTLFGTSETGQVMNSQEIADYFDDEGCTNTTHITNRVPRIYID